MPKMKRYTIKGILAWNPCERYTEEYLRELMGRRESVSLIEILAADVLAEDAVWAACHAMNDRQRRHFACDCAESVLHLANDPRSSEAVRVARLYADGRATDDELAAAWAAARDAARDAARAAAWAAAWAAASAAARAARAAAWDAAWDAARAAAWNAALDAAWDAARAAARDAARDAAWDAARQTLLMLALAGEIE